MDKKVDFHSKLLIIDGLNLFFRNFATINILNPEGVPVGGLAGFIRSLGSLVHLTQPTGVYIIFDGVGSSINRKNLVPEYKSNRGLRRITNWDIYDNIEEESDSKVDQITRLIQYLQCLPVKIGMIDKAEADDMIAYMCKTLPETENSNIIIVSSDKDYLQLLNKNVVVYRPVNKVFYRTRELKEELKIHPANFLLYKTLLGDKSDQLKGIRGLGPKTLIKKFPELVKTPLTLNNIFEIAEKKLTEHKIYAQILHQEDDLRKSYLIMDLSNPILDDRQIRYIDDLIKQPNNKFYKKIFLEMYEEDGIGHFIKNIESWLVDTFFDLTLHKS